MVRFRARKIGGGIARTLGEKPFRKLLASDGLCHLHKGSDSRYFAVVGEGVRRPESRAGGRLEQLSFKGVGRNLFEAGEKGWFGLILDGSAQQTREAHERSAVACRAGTVQRLVDDQFTVGA